MANLAAVSRQLARMAEQHMTDACRIVRITETFNPTTGLTEQTETLIYEGVCSIKATAMGERVREAAGALITLKAYLVHLPRTVEGVQEGDALRVTASSDTDLVGRRLWVKDVLFATEPTARRIVAEYQHEEPA